MTLAVGAKYPWSTFHKLINMGVQAPQAVIMASDSRWTYDNYNIPYEDIGTKLFQLGKDCGAVYSGDVEAGDDCITELSKKLAKRKIPNSQRSLFMAETTFFRVYKHYKQKRIEQRREVYPLYILVGVCDSGGQASLIYVSSQSDFKPIFLEGVYGVGIREACASFEEKLKREVDSKVNKELETRRHYLAATRDVPIQEGPEQVGIVLAAMLEDVIEAGTYKEIGGKVQYGIVTKDGFQRRELAKTTDPTNEESWTRTTANPEELTTFRQKFPQRFSLSVNPENINSFGIFQISD